MSYIHVVQIQNQDKDNKRKTFSPAASGVIIVMNMSEKTKQKKVQSCLVYSTQELVFCQFNVTGVTTASILENMRVLMSEYQEDERGIGDP